MNEKQKIVQGCFNLVLFIKQADITGEFPHSEDRIRVPP